MDIWAGASLVIASILRAQPLSRSLPCRDGANPRRRFATAKGIQFGQFRDPHTAQFPHEVCRANLGADFGVQFAAEVTQGLRLVDALGSFDSPQPIDLCAGFQGAGDQRGGRGVSLGVDLVRQRKGALLVGIVCLASLCA